MSVQKILTTAEKLDQLAYIKLQRGNLISKRDQLIAKETPPELKVRIAEIEQEFVDPLAKADQAIVALEAEIKKETLMHGETISGSTLQCVYTRGRYSYSENPKSGFEPANIYRRLGDPSVAIR